ncbi:hypothetical protein J2W42_005842 [Rhizobium tibeticum]|nr:hypothetical protein [Rhizobium tibeticum]
MNDVSVQVSIPLRQTYRDRWMMKGSVVSILSKTVNEHRTGF